MSANDRDEGSAESSNETKEGSANSRRSDTSPPPRRRRFFTRLNAFIAAIAIVIGIAVLILVLALIYRLGYIDRYVASQIKDDFSKYGIRAEIKNFHATLPPHAVEMQAIELYDALSGEKLGKIDRLLATVRIQDLYALNLKRHVD